MVYSTFLAAFVAALSTAIAAPLEARAVPASAADFSELQRAAELSSGAYSGCTGSAFDVTITKQLNNVATDTQGYIGYSSSLKRISVVMRGSTSPEDFLNDLDTVLVTPVLSGVNFPAGTQIMNGIYSPWASVHTDVITEVKRLIGLYPTYTLESTGHSLGGSLTYLSYIDLAQNFPSKNITSNALAAFPIGNTQFANFGTAQKGLLRRGNNFEDGVPNMYADMFTHYGVEYYGAGTLATTVECSGERDPACSAGDGAYSVTAGHLSSFGIVQGSAGCGGGVPTSV